MNTCVRLLILLPFIVIINSTSDVGATGCSIGAGEAGGGHGLIFLALFLLVFASLVLTSLTLRCARRLDSTRQRCERRRIRAS
jgi:hypothetical protein